MKQILTFFLVIYSVSIHAQNIEQLYGKWQYEDVYEKEKIDSVGLKMLQLFFGDMALSFEENGHYEASMRKTTEEGTWKLDTTTNIITLTQLKGKKDEMGLVTLSETRLVISVGKGTFIFNRVK